MIVWYIHGAGASDKSFAWLHTQLNIPAQFFSYSVDEPTESAIQRLAFAIATDGRSAMLVGHSLGGVMACACAATANVERLVTICAPFGGVRHAELLSLFYRHPLLRDLRSYGPLLTTLRNTRIGKPHLAIVGTSGLPFYTETNDGVVPLTSQTALSGPRYQSVALNHFEVLLSEEVVDLIRGFTLETT